MAINHDIQKVQSSSIQNLPIEASRVLELLDDIEEFTISIGKKIMSELNSKGENIHIKLYDY